jgi:hypothetical protein
MEQCLSAQLKRQKGWCNMYYIQDFDDYELKSGDFMKKELER